MGRRLGASGVALVAMVATGTAAAAPTRCARPVEETAIQVAAIQQELMVAALTCNKVASFNAFQTTYSKQLRRSDWELQRMFRRLFGRRGERKYHAFKTRLANTSSMRSIHDNAAYCQQAAQVFSTALAPGKPTLAAFVSDVAPHDAGPVESCDALRAARLAARPVPDVVPTPNPLRVAALAPAPAAAMPAAAQPAAAHETAAQPVAAATKAQESKADVKSAKTDDGWFSSMFGSDDAASQPAAVKASAQKPVKAATETAAAQPVAPPQASASQTAAVSPAKPAEGKKSSGWLSGLFN